MTSTKSRGRGCRAQGDGPEFYDTLGCHRSWVALLVTFIFDPRYSLNTRSENVEHAAHVADVAAQPAE